MEKINKTSISFIILIIVMLFIAGCSTTNSKNDENSFQLSSFKGGDNGLTLSFENNAPPKVVRDQGLEPFSIRLLIQNMGETNIKENTAFVNLDGFNKANFGIENTSKPLLALRGVRKEGSNVIDGGKEQIVFSNLKYNSSVISGSMPIKIFANICYPYETKVVALVCINGNTIPALDKKAEICSLSGEKKIANSGAPVKVENFKEFPYGRHSVQFVFDIVHNPTSEDANIYENGSIDSSCRIDGFPASSSQALFKRDKVIYKVNTGIPGLNCEGTGNNTNTITLTNNKYTVTCIQNTYGQNEYEKPISIFLYYDYLDRKSTVINIQHIQTQ